MSDLGIEVTGTQEVIDNLDQLAGRVLDMSPVLDAVHMTFLNQERSRFDYEGPGWAALASSTVAQKQRKGWPETILEATGALRASLTEEDASGAVWEPILGPAAAGAVMGTDLKATDSRGKWADTALGAFHQEGTSRMPARPVIDDVDVLGISWTEIISDWLLAAEVAEL